MSEIGVLTALGGTQPQVISWRQSGPLLLSELNHIKLIGMSKRITNALPKTVERFVTKIDFEHEIFTGIGSEYHSQRDPTAA